MVVAPNGNSEPQSGNGEGSHQDPADDFDSKLNSAISGRLKQFEKSIMKQFGEMIQANKVTPKQEPEQIDEVKEIKKQLALVMEREKQKDAELTRQRVNASLSDELAKVGVSNTHMKHAIGFLTAVDKSVRVNEDGEIVMKHQGVEYDLPSAVNMWSKSDDAKIYLSPRDIKGSGSSKVSQTRQTTSNDQPSMEEMGRAVIDELFGR